MIIGIMLDGLRKKIDGFGPALSLEGFVALSLELVG
jgi:hypothetical protein